MKETLALNFTKEIVFEEYLFVIGIITDNDESKDSKDTGQTFYPSSSKAKEKDYADIESLMRTLKAQVVELKRRSSDTPTSSKPPNSFPFRRNNKNNNNNNHLAKFRQSLNFVLNIKSIV